MAQSPIKNASSYRTDSLILCPIIEYTVRIKNAYVPHLQIPFHYVTA